MNLMMRRIALVLRRKYLLSKKAVISIFCIFLLISIFIVSTVTFSSEPQQKPAATIDNSQQESFPPEDSIHNDDTAPKDDSDSSQKTPQFNVSSISIGKTKGGFGVSATIKNDGKDQITDIEWSLTITHEKKLKTMKEKSSVISILSTGETAVIKSGVIFGFGRIHVSVVVNGIEKSAEGWQLFIFTWIKK